VIVIDDKHTSEIYMLRFSGFYPKSVNRSSGEKTVDRSCFIFLCVHRSCSAALRFRCSVSVCGVRLCTSGVNDGFVFFGGVVSE
jgi:hypothetical protein